MVRFKKPLQTMQSNFTGSGGKASANYKAAIPNVTNWQANASSDTAEANYEAKVNEAIANKTRQKRVAQVSNAEWQQRAINKGGQTIGVGISASGDKWNRGYSPIATALQGVALPDKTTDPIANLTNRAGAVVSAEVAAKKARKGGA